MGDILFLAHRVPYPPDRGDKIRGFHILKHTRRQEARPPDRVRRRSRRPEAEGRADQIYRQSLDRVARQVAAGGGRAALIQHRPVSLTAFDNDALRQAVDNILERHRIDTIYVFSSQMAQYLPHRPRQQVIMDFVDMDSAKFAAYAKSSKGPMGWMLGREARLLLAHEKAIAARADANLFVSEAEADLFRQRTARRPRPCDRERHRHRILRSRRRPSSGST
jgi:hypothetical protein